MVCSLSSYQNVMILCSDQLQTLFYFKPTCNLACFPNLLVKISGQF